MGQLSDQAQLMTGAEGLSVRMIQDASPGQLAQDGVLGAVWHPAAGNTGEVLDPAELDTDLCVAIPTLPPTEGAVLEQWRAGGELQEGRHGPACYRHNDSLLFVTISIPEREGDIGSAAQEAYSALFDVMAERGFTHLVRCWNYFADINLDQESPLGTLERYRLFNIGRQAAFAAAEHSAEVGAPAACALGAHEGPLTIYALASRSEPRCVENPRQVSAYRYPERYGPKSPSFSRGSVLRCADGGQVLFVSGTASIVGHESLHLDDVVAQTEESLRNIVTVVAQANLGSGGEVFSSHKLCYKVFVRHAGDAHKVAETVRRVLGEATNMVVLRADVCRAELLVEIEAVGFA